MRFLLGIDIGTSACKAALFTPDGQVVAQAAAEYEVSYPHEGWAEQHPDDWWNAVCAVTRAITAQAGVDARNIAGIGVDGQSWAAVAVDKAGNALAPTPIWTDTRARAECARILEEIPAQQLFAVSGNPLQPCYTLPKILWYKKPNFSSFTSRTRTRHQRNVPL